MSDLKSLLQIITEADAIGSYDGYISKLAKLASERASELQQRVVELEEEVEELWAMIGDMKNRQQFSYNNVKELYHQMAAQILVYETVIKDKEEHDNAKHE